MSWEFFYAKYVAIHLCSVFSIPCHLQYEFIFNINLHYLKALVDPAWGIGVNKITSIIFYFVIFFYFSE